MTEVKRPISFPTPEELARSAIEKSAGVLRQGIMSAFSHYTGEEELQISITDYKKPVRDLVMGELQAKGWKVVPGIVYTSTHREDVWLIEANVNPVTC